jgi:group I intron endonuclease
MNGTIYNLAETTPKQLAKIVQGNAGVYMWTNNVNGKTYVGSSIDLARRLLEYTNPARLERELARGESIIYKAILKYGYTAFSFQVLEVVETDPSLSKSDNNKRLQKAEQVHIDLIKPVYNILANAGSNRGHKLSDETRAKMSSAKEGKPSHRKGSTQSEISKLLMRENSGRKRPVYMYSPDKVLLGTFSSVGECALASGASRFQVGRGIKSGNLTAGKYFSLVPL